ncbi:MAG: NAD(P)/FAD-dependent oxidoreductase [Alphaproteobacteria bacterium]|nr:NAD(P)/FAD-dependent oxidoreductase [Alphaproteobacteria bacterium]MCB9796839.1 NAD(P)/FAD-dependent oxidoreductase [Alphaproteobacteria bacterium]
MSTQRYDAVVVGSGPNGLAAAIRLAQAGRSVCVFEARDRPGGGARSEEFHASGFVRDICSAIHPMAAAYRSLRALPLEPHGLTWVQPDAPLAHPLDDGPAVVLERDLEATCANLGEDGGAYRRMMQPLLQRWEALFDDALAPPGLPSSPLLLARFGVQALLPATWLAALRFRGPRGAALLAGLAAHSILPLDRSPSSAIGLMLGIAGHAVGWPFPKGGAQALSDALAGYLESLGGALILGHEVTRVEELPTDGPVLFDTSPRDMSRICGDTLPERYTRRLSKLRYGPGAFKLDWALSEPIPWADPAVVRAATVHVGGTLAELAESERAPWAGRCVERPFVLLAQQSLFDDTRAPAGRHVAWGYCHVPNGDVSDRMEAIEAQVERYAPGFRDIILGRHVTTCADLERYNPNYIGGDVNGGAPDLDQLFTRPVTRVVPYATPNPRVFLCSASTPPGGGVHGACGVNAAEAALRRWPARA